MFLPSVIYNYYIHAWSRKCIITFKRRNEGEEFSHETSTGRQNNLESTPRDRPKHVPVPVPVALRAVPDKSKPFQLFLGHQKRGGGAEEVPSTRVTF